METPVTDRINYNTTCLNYDTSHRLPASQSLHVHVFFNLRCWVIRDVFKIEINNGQKHTYEKTRQSLKKNLCY